MSNYLSDEKKEELAKLAEKATPGEWMYAGQQFIFQNESSAMIAEIRGWGADLGLDDNGRFIAAANPAAISSLIEENVELKAERLDFEEREAACCPEDVGFEEWIGTLKTKLERAEAERDEARNCTVCTWCGEIKRGLDSWEKKTDAMFQHTETCEKSPIKLLLNTKIELAAAEAERDKLREFIENIQIESGVGSDPCVILHKIDKLADAALKNGAGA